MWREKRIIKVIKIKWKSYEIYFSSRHYLVFFSSLTFFPSFRKRKRSLKKILKFHVYALSYCFSSRHKWLLLENNVWRTFETLERIMHERIPMKLQYFYRKEHGKNITAIIIKLRLKPLPQQTVYNMMQ